nr:DNA-directed RNA polymerase I subunit [Naematelia aurantialba]
MSHSNAIASSSTHPALNKPKQTKDKHHSKHIHSKSSKPKVRPDKVKDKSKDKERSGPFEHHLSRMRLSVPPKYSGDWLTGVREVLDGMIMRYMPQLNGVLLAHWEHEFMDDTVKFINECPFGVCEVQFRSILWAPKIGQRLHGTHSLSSPSHLSLLFSKTFNISIPLQHIPLDQYEFEATDPVDGNGDSDSDDEDEDEDEGVHEVGRWKRKKDGKMLGEGGKGIKFTVIGMQVSNQMLSLTGSLLPDPTNPPPLPETSVTIRAASPSVSPEPGPEAVTKGAPTSMDVDTPVRKQRQKPTSGMLPANEAYDAELQPLPSHAALEETIDERFLSARELKKKRKDEEKRKRDERKARKEGQTMQAVEQVAAGHMVEAKGTGQPAQEGGMKKRKADGGAERAERKQKKSKA